LRLIVASNRAPHLSVVLETVHNNVKVVQYKYETCTLDDILGKVVEYKELTEILVRGKSPNMGRCIISYQEVLRLLLKNVNDQAEEAVFCNRSCSGLRY